MRDISRRGFLGGTAACAVAAALPVLVAPELSGVAINMAYQASMPPAFSNAFSNALLAQLEWARRAMDEMAAITFEQLGAPGGLDGR